MISDVPPAIFNLPGNGSDAECGYLTNMSVTSVTGKRMKVTVAADGRIVWRDRNGRSVTYDGTYVRNHTKHTVRVVGY